jgi:hypothetical protein
MTREGRAGGATKPLMPRSAEEVAEQARILWVGGGVLGLGESSLAPEMEATEGGIEGRSGLEELGEDEGGR